MGHLDIVYATRTGCTEDVVRSLARTLQELGHDPRVHDVRTAPQAPTGVAVLVSGIRAGRWHAPLLAWAKAHAAGLSAHRLAAVSVGLEVLTDQPAAGERTLAAMESVGLRPDLALALPGRFLLREYGFLERQVMRRIGRDKGLAEGDYRDQERERTAAATIATLL